jgi:hypothetical protein
MVDFLRNQRCSHYNATIETHMKMEAAYLSETKVTPPTSTGCKYPKDELILVVNHCEA